MITKQAMSSAITKEIKALLSQEPGLSIKDVATELKTNRQYMAGFLAALEERGDVASRRVGPARIYFNASGGG